VRWGGLRDIEATEVTKIIFGGSLLMKVRVVGVKLDHESGVARSIMRPHEQAIWYLREAKCPNVFIKLLVNETNNGTGQGAVLLQNLWLLCLCEGLQQI
jgi:hypothetical protein